MIQRRTTSPHLHQFASFVLLLLSCCIATGFTSSSVSTRPANTKRQAFISMDAGEVMEGCSTAGGAFTLPWTATSSSEVAFRPRLLNLPEPSTSLQKVRDQCPSDLVWKDFWDHQLHVMEEHLTDLREIPAIGNKIDATPSMNFARAYNAEKHVLCLNWAFTSREFRKIRLTLYIDQKTGTQVFNSLWYPSYDRNLPVLGVDFLRFNHGKKHLTVTDLQPIHNNNGDDYESHHYPHLPYEHLLADIQKDYPSLQGQMSKRFYDEAQFFSKHMLFGRFADNESVLSNDLAQAFPRYLGVYLDLLRRTPRTTDPAEVEAIRDGQNKYDAYSAARDPAIHMMRKVFGEEWADAYVHEFLFDQSRI